MAYFFKPDCLRILFNVPGAKSSPGLPATVTRPGLVGCLNCRWLPLVVTKYQPSWPSIRNMSDTFTTEATTSVAPLPNYEVERRGRVLPSNEAALSASSTSLHRSSKLPARDRSNLRLDRLDEFAAAHFHGGAVSLCATPKATIHHNEAAKTSTNAKTTAIAIRVSHPATVK